MRATEALATLSRLGLILEPRDGRLWVEPRDRITPEARAIIVEYRDTLLNLVSVPVPAENIPTPSAGLGVISDRISAYHERIAIVIEDGRETHDDAVRIAAEEVGVPIERLAQLQVAEWRSRIQALPPQSDHPALITLQAALIAQLALPWMTEAARHGWTDLELFGAHPTAPAVRVECWGLAVSIAMSPFNRRSRSGEIRRTRLVAIDQNRAVIETPTGERFGANRFDRGLDEATPIWDHPADLQAANGSRVAVNRASARERGVQ